MAKPPPATLQSLEAKFALANVLVMVLLLLVPVCLMYIEVFFSAVAAGHPDGQKIMALKNTGTGLMLKDAVV